MQAEIIILTSLLITTIGLRARLTNKTPEKNAQNCRKNVFFVCDNRPLFGAGAIVINWVESVTKRILRSLQNCATVLKIHDAENFLRASKKRLRNDLENACETIREERKVTVSDI